VRTQPLAEVRAQVRERLVAVGTQELARREGTDKLAQWKQDAAKAALPAALVVSRDQAQGVASQVVLAALHADASTLPAWVGVDLGQGGYAVVRVNKVLPRGEAPQAVQQRDRDQYAQLWGAAEVQAYYATLRERFKAQTLVTASALADAPTTNK